MCEWMCMCARAVCMCVCMCICARACAYMRFNTFVQRHYVYACMEVHVYKYTHVSEYVSLTKTHFGHASIYVHMDVLTNTNVCV